MDLQVLIRGNLTSARYREEILRPIVTPYAGEVGPRFLLVHDYARYHVVECASDFEGMTALAQLTGQHVRWT